MKSIYLVLLHLLCATFIHAQGIEDQINNINQQLLELETSQTNLQSQLESLKLRWIQAEIGKVGVPITNTQQEVVNHLAYQFSYNEEHEQPNWVMHMILPDIKNGNVSRTNDFRPDTMVTTGSSEEVDYFLKELNEDGETYTYDGFGYDRGHLAPSADFRWSQRALSESYFYSNMSPQIADFNRLSWAELEGWLRGYVLQNDVSLFVVTIPVFETELEKIARSKNNLSIPSSFIKAAIDLENNQAVAFLLPHAKNPKPLESYAISIDDAEKMIGFNLFPNLTKLGIETIESEIDITKWMPDSEKNDVLAIDFRNLPKGSFNTNQVSSLVNDGKKHTVCGTVVSTKKHAKGHVFINLDKKFPNQIFSVSIFNKSIVNFDYEPEKYLKDKKVCFTGKIAEYQGTPSMTISSGRAVDLYFKK